MSRYYPFKDYEFASVTTILGATSDKSAPLLHWAVNCFEQWLQENTDILVIAAAIEDEERRRETLFKLYEQGKKEFRSVSKKALDIGSRTHEAIEHWLRNEAHDVPADIDKPYHAAINWFVDNNVEVISVEKSVYSELNFWAGTQDLKVKVTPTWKDAGENLGRECVYIIDLKTSKAFYEPEMPLQVNAYANADGNEDVVGTGVLRLDKESGIPYFKDYTSTMHMDYVSFLCRRSVFYLDHAKKGVRIDFLKNYKGAI